MNLALCHGMEHENPQTLPFKMYIKFKESEIADAKMLSEDAYIGIDKDGNRVGIEIWKASQNAILPISRDIAEN